MSCALPVDVRFLRQVSVLWFMQGFLWWFILKLILRSIFLAGKFLSLRCHLFIVPVLLKQCDGCRLRCDCSNWIGRQPTFILCGHLNNQFYGWSCSVYAPLYLNDNTFIIEDNTFVVCSLYEDEGNKCLCLAHQYVFLRVQYLSKESNIMKIYMQANSI
jgi:hypothetical protein